MRFLIPSFSLALFHAGIAAPVTPAASVSAPAFAQPAVGVLSGERAKLLAGVSTLPKLGAPGPIALWGATAFPVVATGGEGDGRAETALVGAVSFEKGRIVLFGHNSYLNPAAGNEGSVGALLVNSVKWATAKPKPCVGTNDAKSEAYLKAKGFDVKRIGGGPEKRNIEDFDVLVLNAQGITGAAEGRDVLNFVRTGGGLVAGMTGWAFEQTSGGKRLNTGNSLNVALMAAGIAFTDAGMGKDKEFAVRAELPPLMNAQLALDAIMRSRKGGAALTPADFSQAGSAIQLALAAQPPGRSAFRAAAMGAVSGGGEIPAAKKPLTEAKDAAARSVLGIETRLLKTAAAEDIKAHPAASEFPGVAPADAQRVTREVTVRPGVPGWTSTGLWVNAGDRISVKVPAAVAGRGFAVRIGCHSDTLYHLDKWQRAPEITRSVPIEGEVTVAANAFGGLVFIEVPGKANVTSDFNVTIAGAIEAPLFVLGRDSDAKWNTVLKMRKAPWAEFVCDKVILICPTENARKVSNPTELMNFWAKVVDAQDEISNQAKDRRRPERIVCDVQISAGYMHSGYPIMVPVSAADEMVTFGGSAAPGWGYYHELGHNHQRGDFTFEGTGEVTNNVLGMYVFHYVLGRDPLTGHGAIAPKKLEQHISLIRRAGDKFAIWKKEPFVALTTYIQLVEGFGWDAWRAYLHSFADPSFGPAPKNDDEKRDQFLVRYSKITKRNLGGFFDFWGIPVSASAKAEAAKFEKWMPKALE